ncbi:helix-turn-helix transcriptional regulator [Herbiconiux sp. VKM Ac-2851]|uniref:helix-turn-helix transcriptional regulator n=1 Tax=Herbiconiux sp. VKM Ac-2851 TaxID=2739025 RepID=UPI0020B156AC|nr:helix-turn-helix transcriptional regulator [Herbiconiux sp. VKM Ac-2851]
MALIAQQFRTTDPERAESALGQIYPDFRFQEPSRAEAFHYGQTVIGDDTATLAITDFGGTMTATAELENAFAVVIVESGRFGVWSGAEGTDPGRPGLARPGEVSSLLDHASIVMANFTENALKHTLRAYHGVDRVDLTYPHLTPLNPAMDRLWVETLNFVRNTILTGGVAQNDSIRTSAFRTLSLVAVEAFGIQTTIPTPPGTGAGAATVRRAQVFMDENAAQAITIEDIAAAVFVSVRGLQVSFRRILGITPLDYLRRVRLNYARAELLSTNPNVTSVREVALHWGFGHLGRFAATYQAAYGELPSHTLQSM